MNNNQLSLFIDPEKRKLTAEEKKYLTGPIVFHGHGWADAVPPKIVNRIPDARSEIVQQKSRYVSLEEYLAVLMTASLECPLDHDYFKIYMCVAIEWSRKSGEKSILGGLLEVNKHDGFKGIESLNQWEVSLLNDLGLKIRNAINRNCRCL